MVPPHGPQNQFSALTAVVSCVIRTHLGKRERVRRESGDALWLHSYAEVLFYSHASVPRPRMSLYFWWNLKITGLKDQVTYYLGKSVSNLTITALVGSKLGYSE